MKINVIKKKFNLTNEGKYNKKDVYELLYQYNYEKIKNVGLYSHIKKRKVPKTPKKFSKLLEKIINETAKTHSNVDLSGYSQLVYTVWGILTIKGKVNKPIYQKVIKNKKDMTNK